MAKRAEFSMDGVRDTITGLVEGLKNPTQPGAAGGAVPRASMEALRNALIGAGVGGVGGLVGEWGKDETERDYGNLIEKSLLGAMLGGGGTMAYRHLVNSGDPSSPAVWQDTYNDVVNPQPKSDLPKPPENAGLSSRLLYGAATNPDVPAAVQATSRAILNHDPVGAMKPIGVPAAAAAAGGATGLLGGAVTKRVLRGATNPGTFLQRQGARISNLTLRPLSLGSIKPMTPKPYEQGRFGRGLGALIQGLGVAAGAYGGYQAAQ